MEAAVQLNHYTGQLQCPKAHELCIQLLTWQEVCMSHLYCHMPDIHCCCQCTYLAMFSLIEVPNGRRAVGNPILEPNMASFLLQGEPWLAVIKGHELDPATQQQDQQRLLLERFQQEHPGFDFSSATFNGMAPNARTFMGGMS
eukprot:GHRR01034204.1.p1 GENE.GHRR01034204.1~~GHRR01034204.1.p1  ORF type:complete len:143 (+),score=28.90 GHRR01034204.1:283-711(+)